MCKTLVASVYATGKEDENQKCVGVFVDNSQPSAALRATNRHIALYF